MISDNDRLIKETGKWLESKEGQAVLAGIARSVIADARSRNLSPAFLKLESLYDPENEEILTEIKQELALFILEKKGLQKRLCAEGDNSRAYLKIAFVHHWIEKTRRSDVDPWRNLYKRTATVLSQSSDFQSFARGAQGTSFSMAPESVPITPLSLEDFSEIPFPDQTVESREFVHINKKDILLVLAAYFWKKVSGIYRGKPVLIDLRDFINWIGFYVTLSPVKPVGEYRKGEQSPDQGSGIDSIPDKDNFNPELVKHWAENFAGSLNEREKLVVFLVYHEGISLNRIAQKMGYKGPSGPKYQIDQVENKLKFFLRDLPWLSPDDLNEDAFLFFLDTVLFILKKSLP